MVVRYSFQCNEYILDAEPAIDFIQCTNWYHIKCTNEQQDHLESYICAMCGTLDETLPYEETSPKLLDRFSIKDILVTLMALYFI
jgi:hypothetical protein